MNDKKRRLTTGEVKQILDEYNRGNAHNYGGVTIDNVRYNLDDVYNQFLLLHDSVMSIIVETMVLGRELR